VTAILIGSAVLALAGCHKSSSGASSTAGSNTVATAASNVATATVSAGPGPTANINTLYTSVKICAPGSTTNCQTIDDIEVDTGASGLRVLASVLAPALAAALPLQVDGNGSNIVECTQYADGFAWGPVVTADMTISGESAVSLPMQIIGSAQFPTPPASCAGTGPLEDTVASYGANGSIGLSVFAQDCGSDCALTTDASINPGFYYACSSPTSCTVTTVPLTSTSGPRQVLNPVTLFATDNNGVIIELPDVASTGAGSTAGALVFGIDTESNNPSDLTSTVLTVDPVGGYVSTSLNGYAYPQSFFDTGSNGLYFDNSITIAGTAVEPSLTQCTGTELTSFYCPSSTLSLSAQVLSTSGVTISVAFSVASAESVVSGAGSLVAFNDLAGSFSGSATGTFDWGLPFYFGRNVYTVIEGKVTTVAIGPYVAF
jgi:hypothetical protein